MFVSVYVYLYIHTDVICGAELNPNHRNTGLVFKIRKEWYTFRLNRDFLFLYYLYLVKFPEIDPEIMIFMEVIAKMFHGVKQKTDAELGSEYEEVGQFWCIWQKFTEGNLVQFNRKFIE